MQSKQVTFGILSTANIGNKTVKAIHESKLGKVICVGSREKEKAQEFAKENDIPRAYDSYEQVLEDDQVDVVYIPLPSTMKREWAIRAAEKKKHVLVEKPFVSESEVRDIIEACHANNVAFMDGTMFVHHIRMKQLKEREFPKLGAIRHVDAVLAANFMEDEETNIRFKKDKEPLGCIGDLGHYCVRTILWAFDWELPERVFCVAEFNKDGNPIDASALLSFSNNRTATLYCSFKSGNRQHLDINGENMVINVRDGIFFPVYWEPHEFPENFKLKQDPHTYYYLIQKEQREECVQVQAFTQVNQMIEDFAKLARNPSEKQANWEQQTLTTQRVLDALLQSARAKAQLDIT